jgi:hypothetical protein
MISKFRTLGKSIERKAALIRWCLPRRKFGPNYVAHLLAAKNTKYLRIAKIAVASFLYHNPNGSVVIHCDEFTYSSAQLEFNYFIKRGTVEILHNSQENQSWQVQKIELLCDIAQLESNFYMDCDVRWNGSLTLSNLITSYVSEFELADKSPFREMLPALKIQNSQVEMLNTTFVYLYPGKFGTAELGEIIEYHNEILNLCGSGAVAKLDIEQVSRLSEQLGYSIFLANSGRKHVALKSEDGHMDGSFLESSYFGATGVEF